MEAADETNSEVNGKSSSPPRSSRPKRSVRLAANQKSFRCDKCKYEFSDKSNLDYHVSIHNTEKPFHCEVCRLLFSKRSSLKVHMRTHAAKKIL